VWSRTDTINGLQRRAATAGRIPVYNGNISACLVPDTLLVSLPLSSSSSRRQVPTARETKRMWVIHGTRGMDKSSIGSPQF
jgi:hypothetical protein